MSKQTDKMLQNLLLHLSTIENAMTDFKHQSANYSFGQILDDSEKTVPVTIFDFQIS